LTILLGRSERSSPKAAQRRATDAGLDGEDASQAANGRGVRTRLCRGIFTAKPLNQCNDLRIAALFTSSAMDRRPGRSPHDGGRRITIALLINENCTACDACEPVCPNQAITAGNPIYVIDPDGQQGELNRAYIAFLH
jgi:ferredoxin